MYNISVLDEGDMEMFGVGNADTPVPRVGEFIASPYDKWSRFEVKEVEHHIMGQSGESVATRVILRVRRVPIHNRGKDVMLG